ncbi:MAG TPA: hypothetical protein PLC40_06865 [Candidatus Hydrogenedentes bacterium]|nr:hypothetical protein [Candidatus Hydrogenedentota bacterium]
MLYWENTLFAGGIILMLCGAVVEAAAPVASSLNYTLEASVFDGAGGVSSSLNYAQIAATAQPAIIGTGTAPAYAAGYGFIPVIAAMLESAEGENELPHPGDLNEDFRLVLSEAIAYLAGWQQGSNPIAYAIRAAYLWQNGENYLYDPAAAPPLCWTLLP